MIRLISLKSEIDVINSEMSILRERWKVISRELQGKCPHIDIKDEHGYDPINSYHIKECNFCKKDLRHG